MYYICIYQNIKISIMTQDEKIELIIEIDSEIISDPVNSYEAGFNDAIRRIIDVLYKK